MQQIPITQIPVHLGERSYQIHLGRTMLDSLAALLGDFFRLKSVVIITDRNVARHHLIPLKKYLEGLHYQTFCIVIPAGENQKSPSRALALYTRLLREGVTRKSLVIALGGGVIGDLAGFVAATYQRGLSLLHLPTSLLAQVDSSVGGKVGINHPRAKNMIGAFHQPVAVWTDVHYLLTLPQRQIICGLGEVIKYAAIFDKSFFQYLETVLPQILRLESDVLLQAVARCITEKAALVSRDEREDGERVILNLGHTIGHALETATNYRVLTHGEAVMLGLIAEGYIAQKMGLLDSVTLERLVALIQRVLWKFKIPSIRQAPVLQAIRVDKKNVSQGRNRFVLLKQFGEVHVVENVEEQLIRESLQLLAQMRFDKS
ncbi:MAG: 3-dehydroquinate synthase [bacterium]